ncbi:17-beta-hydroxysteroid dehydrogenase 13 [Colletotrichum trifolii]|uniref:17-beta-hydroxysteroid dehydrogenase 13 n=1 Tax=Colletotrichum trifolii TaxID=5466 RepID=A0A4R8R9I4_COLTR|nr:17-beta-hydroxysteroid dehydrogenase 13 [Colletotrichum trifolii]
MSTTKTNETLLVVGAGPGIGRSVTTLFASKRYSNVALVARSSDQLGIEKASIEEAVGSHVKVKTFAVDVVETEAFTNALDQADSELGKPSCVFFNAARVQPSELLKHDIKEIECDFKINVSALYLVAQRYIPHLLELAKSNSGSPPALLVTSSILPLDPHPQFFALSLVKASQRNMMQSLRKTYDSEGVHIGLINVGGQVSPEHETWNPSNIAQKTWGWFFQIKEKPSFEVVI